MKRSSLIWSAAVLGLALAAPAMAADYGMPPDVESKTKTYCAEVFSKSFSLQEICMRNEGEAYQKLGGQRYPSVETIEFTVSQEAEKARIRHNAGYHDPNWHDTCPAPYRMTDRDGCKLR